MKVRVKKEFKLFGPVYVVEKKYFFTPWMFVFLSADKNIALKHAQEFALNKNIIAEWKS